MSRAGVMRFPDREKWAPVPGWPYAVSSHGRARRSTGAPSTYAGRLLVVSPNTSGYLMFGMADGERVKRTLIHREVLRAFGPPCPSDEHEVNHIDGDPKNNRVENLEWVTRKQNATHTVKMGRHQSQVLSEKDALDVYERAHSGEEAIADIAREYGITEVGVRGIRNGHSWSWLTGHDSSENRKWVRLNPDKVREIRARLEAGGETYAEIGKDYGVTGDAIGKIANGKTWSHVTAYRGG